MANDPINTFGMTVEQLLDLDQAAIDSLDERNLSHAVRTLALAANKRVNRLRQYAQKNKRDGKYVEKAGGPGVDFNALYAVSERKKIGTDGEYEYGKIRKFGMGRTKITPEKVDDYKTEFTRASNFLRAKSSKVKGAIELRKKKEKALFGKTREDEIKKKIKKGMTKKERNKIRRETQKEFSDLMSDVYSEYNRFKEEEALEGMYDVKKGKRYLKKIGKKMMSGMSGEQARQDLSGEVTTTYEEKRKKQNEELQNAIQSAQEEPLFADEKETYMGLFDDENK